MTLELGLEAWRFGKQPYGKGDRERITSEKKSKKAQSVQEAYLDFGKY